VEECLNNLLVRFICWNRHHHRVTQLKLEFTDDLINFLDVEKFRGELTREQE